VPNFAAAQLDDISCELLYLMVRDTKPNVVVEISPCGGWSTSWILNALHDNGHGKLVSFDVVDYSCRKVPADLAAGIRTFHQGDVQKSEHLPEKIDFLLMDSDHTAPFAEWYIAEVFPRVRSGGTVIVDDVFHREGTAESGGEGDVVLAWLKERGIDYFQASNHHAPDNCAAVQHSRELRGLNDPIVKTEPCNPAIYFTMP
jgi:predicted O-methyltransferase YrrM